jgi:ABC-type phosphate transport system permease subunit
MGRWLVVFGIALVLLGLAWPWLSKLGLGRLPGDLRFEREGFGLYFPLTTSLIVSLAISLLLGLFHR